MSSRDNDFWIGLSILFLMFCGFVLYNAPQVLVVPLALLGAGVFSFAFAITRPAICRESLYFGILGTAAVFWFAFFLAGPPRLLTLGLDLGWPGLFWTDWIDSTRGFRDWGFYSELFLRHFFWGPFKWVDPVTLSTLWWVMAVSGFFLSFLYPNDFRESPYQVAKKEPPGVPHITDFGEGGFELLEIFWAPLLALPRRVAILRGSWTARAVAALEGLLIGCLGLILLAMSWHLLPSSQAVPVFIGSAVVAFTLSGFLYVWAEPIVLGKREALIEIARQEEAEKRERELYWQQMREEAARAREQAQLTVSEQTSSATDTPNEPVDGTSTEAPPETKKPSKADFWADGGGDF